MYPHIYYWFKKNGCGSQCYQPLKTTWLIISLDATPFLSSAVRLLKKALHTFLLWLSPLPPDCRSVKPAAPHLFKYLTWTWCPAPHQVDQHSGHHFLRSVPSVHTNLLVSQVTVQEKDGLWILFLLSPSVTFFYLTLTCTIPLCFTSILE